MRSNESSSQPSKYFFKYIYIYHNIDNGSNTKFL